MNDTVPSKKKPSKLEEFKLFYEAVDAPEYLTGADQPSRKTSFRERRIARRRK
jgi:hypothetical protein